MLTTAAVTAQVRIVKLLDETSALVAIRALLAGAGKARLAVAFWGKGAIERLGLDRPGLALEILCNLDSGACNPAELRGLLDRPGVILRSHPALHSKVYWTPTGAVLGSSNASANGLALESDMATGWHEANIALDDPTILADIDRWFTTLFDAGYAITGDDLDRAAMIWKSRVRLPASLFEAWRRTRDHPWWAKVKLVWWSDDLDAADTAWLEEEITAGRLDDSVGAYNGWGEHIAKGDLLIDFDINGRSPHFTGIWQGLSGGGDSHLQLVARIEKIAVPGLGQFALSPAEREALGAIAPTAIKRYAEDGRNAIIGFVRAMELVDARSAASLSRDFDHAMRRIYDEATTFGYRPGQFLRMLGEHGGMETARRLVRGSATRGLETLWKHGRLDLSVEALILNPQWRPLFCDEELATARQRLKQFSYIVED